MKLHQTQTEFNCGIDLHARSMYACVMDRDGEILVHRNIRNNDFSYFLNLVEPYRHDLTVACECTFNWYWLSDACADAKIHFALGHALYMKAIKGTKTKNDKVDSKKIADLLRTNYLPEAYCCSVEKRPVRDLLRRRIWLVRLRARIEGRMTAGVQVHGQVPLTRQEKRDATKQHSLRKERGRSRNTQTSSLRNMASVEPTRSSHTDWPSLFTTCSEAEKSLTSSNSSKAKSNLHN